jgi:Carboxypeptidase regulatory-like domain
LQLGETENGGTTKTQRRSELKLSRFFKHLSVAIACFSFLLIAGVAKGQTVSGSIVGTVTDASGAVVANATVTATNTGTNIVRTVKTDGSGNYSIPLLQIGNYVIKIGAAGFKSYAASGVNVTANAVARVDAKLEIGEVSQTVEISDTSAPALQTDTSTVESTLAPAQVEELPLNGRNFVGLVATTPGIAEGGSSGISSGTRPDDRRQSSDITANGQPDNNNNYMIDGIDDNERMIGTVLVRPSIDAIQEVHVQTNLYSAQYGRTAGAVINIVTRSGTNQFHGSLYEFVRNDMFDAKDFFNVPQANNPLAGKKPEYRQNQFGGSIGGPILRDRTFFFGDFEDLRIVQGVTAFAPTPSPCELGAVACGPPGGTAVQQLGNFSDLLPTTIIYDPVTQNPYPNNIIPVGSIDPISATYAKLFPTNSSCPSGPQSCTFAHTPTRTQFQSTFDIRVDQHFNAKNYLYSRYSWNDTSTFTPGALPQVTLGGKTIQPGGTAGGYTFAGPAKERQQNFVLSLTHTFLPSLVLQLTASYQRSTIGSYPLNYGQNLNTTFGGPNVNVNATSSGLAPVSIQNYNSFGAGAPPNALGDAQYIPLLQYDNVFQYSGDMIWTHGNHTFNIGLGLIRRQVMLDQSASPKGIYTFNADLTNSNEGAQTGTGGNGFATFLTGYADTMVRALSLYQSNVRGWEPSAYIQDDWRAMPWLTLNLGVRYDIFTPYTEKNDHMSNFDPTVPGVLAGGKMIIAGIDGYGRTAGVHTDLTEFSPRIGFAATLPGHTVLRGGGGMTFFPTNYFAGSVLRNQPFTSSTSLQAQYGQAPGSIQSSNTSQPGYVPYFAGSPFGPATATTTCLTNACAVATTGQPLIGFSSAGGELFNYNNAYAYQYSLQVEKQFWGNVLTVGYVGSQDHRLREGNNLDQPLPPAVTGGCGGVYVVNKKMTLPNPCQPYYAALPNTGSVNPAQTWGRSSYSGLQVEFSRHSANGLTFDTSYAWSHSLANTGIGSAGSTGGNYGTWWQNQRYDWGNSGFDVPQRWTLTLAYQLPFGNSLHGAAGELVKGWSFNTLTIWSTGLPVTITQSGGLVKINDGVGSDRPNVVGNPRLSNPSIHQWFNISAFRQQPLGMPGNEHNNQIFAPNHKSVSFSVMKVFPIHEAISLQARAEAFNLTNSPNFSAPNTAIGGYDTNGVPTAANFFGQVQSTLPGLPSRQLQFALKVLF